MPDHPSSLTCSKLYRGIPLAHRQHLHPGRCSRVHGHSWAIRLTFACDTLDAHGFVIDFGGLAFIAEWIDTHLDHAIMLSRADPLAETLVAAAAEVFHVFWVDSASCEGLAQALAAALGPEVRARTEGRAWISRIDVWEDDANHVAYSLPTGCS